MNYYESFDFCVVSSEEKPIENILQSHIEDHVLANYDWMSESVRTMLYKELLNEKIDNSSEISNLDYIFKTISPSLTTYTLRGLEHLSFYYILLRACYRDSSNISCSEPTKILGQTDFDLLADQVSNILVDSMEPNTIDVSWTDPKRPNGAIKSFTIRYNLLEMNDTEKILCVPFKEVKEKRKKRITGVISGNYSVTILVEII